MSHQRLFATNALCCRAVFSISWLWFSFSLGRREPESLKLAVGQILRLATSLCAKFFSSHMHTFVFYVRGLCSGGEATRLPCHSSCLISVLMYKQRVRPASNKQFFQPALSALHSHTHFLCVVHWGNDFQDGRLPLTVTSVRLTSPRVG